MTDSPASAAYRTIEVAIEAYLSLLEAPPPLEDAHFRVGQLIEALDRLVIAHHDSPDLEPSEDQPEPPRGDWTNTMEKASVAFPMLTWFAFVYPRDGFEQPVSSRDPILELSEIADDLIKVKWFASNAGPADAVWEFRFGYQAHWGRHLHWVRAYLQDYHY